MKKNKWLNGAVPALCIHLSVGSVYAWSVLTKHIAAELNSQISTVTWAFSIAMFSLGMAAAFLGGMVERLGPKKSAFISCILFGAGMLGSGVAAMLGSVPLLLIMYGVVGGTGLGIGYITPVKTLLRWFYDKKGLASGIAVMGFGFAAMIAGPVMEGIIKNLGLASMFFIMGGVYIVMMFIAYLLFDVPPQGYEKPSQTQGKAPAESLNLKQALKRPAFYGVWLMLFLNIACGISLIAIASPLLQDKFTVMTAGAAAAVVSSMSFTNGIGRFGWASLSDKVGRPAVFTGFMLLQVGLLAVLALTGSQWVYIIVLCVITSCYGAGFACLPPYISDLFGTENFNQIYGKALTAWAAAGIIGPFFATYIREATGNYTTMLWVLAGLLLLGCAVSAVPALAYKKRHGKFKL